MTTTEIPSLDPTMDPALAPQQVGVQPEAHEKPLDVELVLCHNPESDTWKQAEGLEAAVFVEKGYIEKPEEMDSDYADYQAASKMLVAKQGEQVVGSARMIMHHPDIGFKTLTDAAQGRLHITSENWGNVQQLDPATIIEVGAISLAPDYRTRAGANEHMISSLYGGIYALGKIHNAPNILASFDEDYLNRFQALFGPYVAPLGPPKDYMGSPTVPVIMNTDDLEKYFAAIGAQSYVDELTLLGQSMVHET